MSNKLPYDKLLKYMEYVFDAEVNVFIQTETLKRLEKTYNSLGIPKKLRNPGKHTASFDRDEFTGLASLMGIIVSVIYWGGAILMAIGSGWNGIIKFFSSFFDTVLIWAIIIVVIVGICLIRGLIVRANDSNKYQKEYADKMKQYNFAIQVDRRRVEEENRRKEYIRQQGNELLRINRNERSKLQKLYSYNILAPDYRNLVAVSSIYEYLKDGRTRSLEIEGGDRGAYNIFREEQLLNHIITNTDVIIQKLDIVIENQRELGNAIRQADNSIKRLTSSVERSSARLENGINRMNENQEISNYEQRRQTAELNYMNFMNTMYLYR